MSALRRSKRRRAPQPAAPVHTQSVAPRLPQPEAPVHPQPEAPAQPQPVAPAPASQLPEVADDDALHQSHNAPIPRAKKRRATTSNDIPIAELVRKEVAKAIASMGSQNVVQGHSAEVDTPPILEPETTHTTPEAPQVDVNMSSQHGLEQAVHSMLNNTGTVNSNVIASAKFDLPLGSIIPAKVKGSIIAGEYVNLVTLVDPHYKEEFDLSIGVNSDGSKGHSLKLTPPKTKSINNINIWTTAMHTYASIYLPFHTDEIGPLMQYIEFIRKMALHPGFGWRHYDEVFRRARQFDFRKWDNVLINQYFSAVSASKPIAHGNSDFRQNTQSSKSSTSGKTIPNGFCIPFHKGAECKRVDCRYQHKCFVCKGSHSFAKCKASSSWKASA